MLAVNCLRPYPEWPGFRGYVNQGLAALKEIVDVRGVNLLLVIPAIWKKAVALLSPSTQFSLALYRDPEIQDEYLTLYARQQKYEEGILDLIHTINVECEELLSQFSGWFITTTDFRRPK